VSAATLELSDERDLELALRLAAWRDGWQAGNAAAEAAWSAGYAHAVAEIKGAQHGLVLLVRGLAETEARRWVLRGERRSRQTFALPHRDDFPGRGDSR
jgi:hypothetical protein